MSAPSGGSPPARPGGADDGPEGRRGWDRVAWMVTRRPRWTLALSLLVLGLPLLALPTMEASHDTLAALPDDAESVRGSAAIAEHFQAAQSDPVVIVFDGDEPMHSGARLSVLADLSRALSRLPGVVSVRSAAMPTGGTTPEEAEQALAGVQTLDREIGELTRGVDDAAAGAGELAGGVRRVEQALARVEAQLPEPGSGLDQAASGADELVAGLRQARGGVGELRRGAGELATSLRQARDGAGRLRADVAEPAAAALREAMSAFQDALLGTTIDPSVRRAAQATGEAFGLITGRYPPGHPRAGQPVRPDYDGLTASLSELETGLAEGAAGAERLATGLDELATGLDELLAGAGRLQDGLAGSAGGMNELRDGIDRLHQRVAGELVPGAEELAGRLRQGHRDLADQAGQLEGAGRATMTGAGQRPFIVTAAMLDQRPDLREQLAFFTTADGTRTRMLVTLDSSPFSSRAIDVSRDVEDVARRIVAGSALADADMVITGSPAFLSAIDAAASRDLPVIVAAVVLGVAAVLIVLLRSLIIPAYMVATVLLTYGAALGAVTLVFQHALGEPGVTWWIPSMLFVVLVVLGIDYSIFLMSRVREEAAVRPTTEAVAEAVRRTGRVITSCGLLLAATFAALLSAPLSSLAMMGFAAAVGILLDTFVVRALLVPSVATLLGRANWWPAARSRVP